VLLTYDENFQEKFNLSYIGLSVLPKHNHEKYRCHERNYLIPT